MSCDYDSEGVQRGFLSMLERMGRSASLCRGDEDRNGMGTNSGKSGMKGCKHAGIC